MNNLQKKIAQFVEEAITRNIKKKQYSMFVDEAVDGSITFHDEK